MPDRDGGRPDNKRNKSKNSGGKRDGGKNDPGQFLADLIARMDACPTAESLNDQVLMPFVLAMEKVCGARGYALNIYGESANLVFSGDPEDTEAIYQIVEAYLDDQADD